MNLHVTNDKYGLYPLEILKRIKNSVNKNNNLIINLGLESKLKDNYITYIDTSKKSLRAYIDSLPTINKVIFHPYTYASYQFLKVLIKKFPCVKVYWVCWSGELYSPHSNNELYEPFSKSYTSIQSFSGRFKARIKKNVKQVLKLLPLRILYTDKLIHSYKFVHYFCALLYSDYEFLCKVKGDSKISYIPFAYLSLDQIMPEYSNFETIGNKIMIGHSASPAGNHYEVIQKVSLINQDYPIFLPLVYGDKLYASIIQQQAEKNFNKVEVLKDKLEGILYYKKLTQVGCAIFNVKVQQGIGNIMALLWMGAKIFLDKNTSTYKDFITWGIAVFSIQENLNELELSNRLNSEQIDNNRKIIYERFNEEKLCADWEKVLQ